MDDYIKSEAVLKESRLHHELDLDGGDPTTPSLYLSPDLKGTFVKVHHCCLKREI